MKRLRVSRYTALAGTAGLALLGAAWLDQPEPAAAPAHTQRPRAAQSVEAPQPTAPTAPTAPAALRAGDVLGTAALAAPTSTPGPAPRPSAVAAAPAPERHAALAALDTTLVAQRSAQDTPKAAKAPKTPVANTDAFAPKSWFVAPPAPPPVAEVAPPPPPPPQAPPLPFKYMGSMQESPTRTVWYLLKGDRLVVAGPGDVIDSVYRTEGAEGGQLRFTYLPLNQRQTLSIGVPP